MTVQELKEQIRAQTDALVALMNQVDAVAQALTVEHQTTDKAFAIEDPGALKDRLFWTAPNQSSMKLSFASSDDRIRTVGGVARDGDTFRAGYKTQQLGTSKDLIQAQKMVETAALKDLGATYPGLFVENPAEPSPKTAA